MRKVRKDQRQSEVEIALTPKLIDVLMALYSEDNSPFLNLKERERDLFYDAGFVLDIVIQTDDKWVSRPSLTSEGRLRANLVLAARQFAQLFNAGYRNFVVFIDDNGEGT